MERGEGLRWRRWLCAAWILLLVPVVSADHEAGDLVVDDPIGDQYDAYPLFGESGDIEQFYVGHESEDSLIMGLDLVTFERHDLAGPDRSSMFVQFRFNYDEQSYSLLSRPFSSLPSAYDNCTAALLRSGDYDTCVDVQIDEQEALIEFTIPRDAITDRRGIAPYAGNELKYIDVSVSDVLIPGSMSTRDEAPDDFKTETYEFRVGERSGGDLLLWSPVPIRASNGEAATYLYEMVAENEGTRDRTVVISTSTAEPSFSVRAPPILDLPANSTIRFPVILSLDFQHEHGRTGTVEVAMEDVEDEAHWGLASLGVEWLAVPQPAGHHNELFLHSEEASTFVPGLSGFNLWTNTLETDEARGATQAPTPPEQATAEGLSTHYTWRFPLDPRLVMGLLVDEDALGRFEIPFISGNDVAQGQANLRLIAGPSQNRTLLASGSSPSEPLSSSQATMLQGDMVPEHRGAIPFEPGMVFALFVDLTVDQPDPVARDLHPRLVVDDASYSLPLAEYSDPFDAKFNSNLRAEVEQPRLRQNPGGVALFPITLINEGERQLTVDLEAASRHADQFDLSADGIKLPAGGTETVQVAVHVPATALPGQTIVGAVMAEATNEAGAYAAVRLAVDIVDPDTEVIARDKIEPSKNNDTPFPTPAVLLVFVLARGIRQRR